MASAQTLQDATVKWTVVRSGFSCTC